MPVNQMSRLELFIGTWNTSGEVLETEGAPATSLYATDTYRRLPGKHFIAHDADARFGEAPTRSLEVIGYDRSSKMYLTRSYDDQGASEQFHAVLKGKRWSIFGESVRFNGKFNADNSQLTGLWELKIESFGWQPWIQLKLVRA